MDERLISERQALSTVARSESRPRLGEALVQRGLLRHKDLEQALQLQRRTGDRLGRILIALGLVRRWQLYQVLAELWGHPFVDLLREPVDHHLARHFDPEDLVARRCIPVRREGGAVLVATAEPPSPALAELVRSALGPVEVKPVVTTDWDIDYAIRRVFRETLLDRATMGLYYHNPSESARTVFTRWQLGALVALGLGIAAGLHLATTLTLIALVALVNVGFMANVLFRFVVSMAGAQFEHVQAIGDEEVAALRDEELPTYTILVPVYREANVIGPLIENLRHLDYPASKLEILLLLEEDDEETIAAARAARPPETVTFVTVPNGEPKTKPKACNVGLFFAKGEYLAIYDAEDRPEPDQLKKAVIAFRKGPPELVCVQAALNYYNATENVLTQMFTLEYSYWFDYILPGLDRLRLPIPLGGTSNHFRTDLLRQLGGWDPFNVTEDADLGLRAAAKGYKVGVINSTTYEEANSRYGNWIRQRSRWIKGYMQTILVHTRNPVKLVRATGWRNLFGFVMLIGGTPLTFLCVPILWALYLAWLLARSQLGQALFPPAVLYVSLFNLLIGNGLMIYLNMLAVFKRRLYSLIPFALLNPLYWMLHSIAAYKALWQLLTRPFYWEKTLHGLSRYATPDAALVRPREPFA
uniref:Glycosyltransferase n=1 Tax=Thermorudis peleae TaxID=1382356 RepID=A0A831X893_9BACT